MAGIEKYLNKQNPHLHWYHDKNRILENAVNNDEISEYHFDLFKVGMNDYWTIILELQFVDGVFDVIKRCEGDFIENLTMFAQEYSEDQEYFKDRNTSLKELSQQSDLLLVFNTLAESQIIKENQSLKSDSRLGHGRALLNADLYYSKISYVFKVAGFNKRNVKGFCSSLVSSYMNCAYSKDLRKIKEFRAALEGLENKLKHYMFDHAPR